LFPLRALTVPTGAQGENGHLSFLNGWGEASHRTVERLGPIANKLSRGKNRPCCPDCRGEKNSESSGGSWGYWQHNYRRSVRGGERRNGEKGIRGKLRQGGPLGTSPPGKGHERLGQRQFSWGEKEPQAGQKTIRHSASACVVTSPHFKLDWGQVKDLFSDLGRF